MNKNFKRYKVADSYITVSKVGNKIVIVDEWNFREEHFYTGTIEQFMKETFKTYQVAAIQYV